MQAYAQGFIDKCAERGVDPTVLLAKLAEGDADLVNRKQVSDNPSFHAALLAKQTGGTSTNKPTAIRPAQVSTNAVKKVIK